MRFLWSFRMTHPCNAGTSLHPWIWGNATACFSTPGPTWGRDGDRGVAQWPVIQNCKIVTSFPKECLAQEKQWWKWSHPPLKGGSTDSKDCKTSVGGVGATAIDPIGSYRTTPIGPSWRVRGFTGANVGTPCQGTVPEKSLRHNGCTRTLRMSEIQVSNVHLLPQLGQPEGCFKWLSTFERSI